MPSLFTRRAVRRLALSFCAVIPFASATKAETVTLIPVADSTLYSESSAEANGAGDHLFAGRTDAAELRRSLLRFDLSAVPAGSTINSVSLTLFVSRTRAQAVPVALHYVNASWGEGTSHAPGEEGGGGAAATNDATWTHRFYNTILWASPGGDYLAAPSASILVDNANRSYTWSTAAMAADVQTWVGAPSGNFGWALIGDESTNQTAKRFNSRTNTSISTRPMLTVNFTPGGGPTGACCFTDGSCTITAATTCAAQGGTYQGDGTSCNPNPCPQPTGACCLPNGSCITTTAGNCSAQSGVYQGNGASCTPNPCSASTTVTLVSMSDNTLYESATGALSNGAGQGFFAGTSDNPILRRRGVVKFDVSGIPPAAIVTEARLRLYVGFTQATGPNNVAVHRALQSWGEGTSDASGNESNGAASSTNDATWIHRFFGTSLWTTPGGDYNSTASTTLSVPAATGFNTWVGSGLIADVQSWFSGMTLNHGWLLRDAETIARSQRRFESRQNADTTRRPMLSITYYIPQEAMGACCLPSGLCTETTASACAAQGGTYQGNNSTCVGASCPIILTPYVDPLPLPAVAQPVSGTSGGAAHYVIAMTEFNQQLHRDLPPTRVWGYGGSYPGPTIEARRNQTVTVTWVNDLRDPQGNLRTTHYLPVDECLRGPDVTGSTPVTVVHVHGSKVASENDGQPEAAFPPGQQSPVYTYPNDQPAATIWYHDHALGITRLNVYMGLAGYFIIRDAFEDALNIPRGEFEVPLAIQDRSFNPDGSLKYHPMWMDHFFGDFILVNGKVWPYLSVKQGKYRFRVLEGSNSRVYRLSLSNGATFWQIGTDNGLLPAPVPLTSLTLSPGERADIVIDFAGLAPGTEVILRNDAPAPFPGTPGVGVIPNIMKFIVTADPGDTDPLPATLVPVPPIPESEAVADRTFILRKMLDLHCPQGELWAINDLMWDDITEYPVLGTTEIWSWVNASGVVHPMHMHLVSFQVLDRQDFELVAGVVTPTGPRVPRPANEGGWKDTVQASPGHITRVITRFNDFPGNFPYHCHVLEHEDHEMMRQFVTVCPAISFGVQPENETACAGGVAVFTVGATGYKLNYSWRRNGVPLTDGPSGTGSTISGAETALLSITGLTFADAGNYDCVVADPCAMPSTSAAATLTLGFAGDADGNGSVNFGDITMVLARFGETTAPFGPGDADGNGVVNFADVTAVLAAFGATCP